MNDERLAALARGLADFRKRTECMLALVDAGDEAAPVLQQALTDVREGMRWAAAKCLADIGTPAALEALLAALEHPRACDAVVEVLRSMTGEDFGADADAWRQHLALGGKAEQKFSLDELVQKAVEPLDASVKQTRHGWIINLRLANQRHQVVKVAAGKTDEEGAEIVIVYSECGPAAPDRYEWALRKNLSIPYGAIGVRDVDGQPTFIVFNTLLLSDLSSSGLRKTIRTVGERADAMERQFTGADER